MKYLKKAIPVDAWQIDMLEIANQGVYPDWIDNALKANKIAMKNPHTLSIVTLEGIMTASEGDYLIKGPKGEFWFNKKNIFEEMYEKWDGSYEYDTGNPIPGAKKETGKIEVELIRDNPDGGADYAFTMSEDVKDSLLRLGIMTAIKNGIKEAEQYMVRDPDEQPEPGDCGWADDSIICDGCNCWKNGK